MTTESGYKEFEKKFIELGKEKQPVKTPTIYTVLPSMDSWNFLFENSVEAYSLCQMIFENNLPTDFFYLSVNPEFERLTGSIRVAGKKASEVFPEIREKNSELLRIYGSVASTGKPERFELYFHPIETKLTVSVISPQKGYFISLFENISNQKAIENKLRKEQEIFKHLIRNSFDMIILLDASGIQRFVSDSCEKILGYRADELVDIPVIDTMIHPDDQENVLIQLQKFLNNNGSGGVQYRHRHKNGQWIYLEALGSNQIDNPSIKAVVLNVRDITEHKNAEQKLKKSENRLIELNATKDKFFSIIAHDLRSPFNSIVGFCDVISNELEHKDYDELEKYVNIIQNSSQLALDLLMNLLEWSRSQTGRMEFNPEQFELVSFIQNLILLFEDLASQKSIEIKTNLPVYLPVFADRAMLSTILRNLISNAIKFSHPDQKIEISVDVKNKSLLFSVRDSGIGINSEDLKKLFKIEDCYSTLGTKNEKGTGLGLILCKEFVEKHGGKICVESESGKGSCFKFTIPH